uniref:Proteasome assembly chaperone 2 n=1 Tax=Clastoptera arizonana TaxID=38151 RepID=A0A1B6E4L8_9HEMI
MKFSVLKEKAIIKDYTAILPAISTGNVGQLTIDLLIASTSAKKIATFWHPGILSVVGHNAFDSNSSEVTHSFEVYASEKCCLVFFQLRSPILKNFEDEFKDLIYTYLIKEQVKELIILASALDIKKFESQVIYPDSVRYSLGIKSRPETAQNLRALKCIELENNETEDLKEDPALRLVLKLIDHCNKNDYSCILLLKYCGEGDTTDHAHSVAYLLDGMYHMLSQQTDNPPKFKIPPSWDLIFGNHTAENLY